MIGCTKANYNLQTLEDFERYTKSLKFSDGFVENFSILYPYDYEKLEETFKNIPKTLETYEKKGLNEEAILLFTESVNLDYRLDGSVKKILGRYPDTGLYLLMPDATFDMQNAIFFDEPRANCEVIQSKTLGKRLVLQKFDRKI